MSSPKAVSQPVPAGGPPAGGDTEFNDLDDLFDFDEGDENDPFSENYKPPNRDDSTKQSKSKTSRNDSGLGIDEEVEVSKKIRAPRVKLDEHRYVFTVRGPLICINCFADFYQQLEYLNSDVKQRI